MNVAQLFCCLRGREDVEIVIAGLPEWSFASPHGDRQFQRLNRSVQRGEFGFIDEKMDVFGHHHVTRNQKVVSSSDLFKSGFEQVTRFGGIQIGKPVVTTEC